MSSASDFEGKRLISESRPPVLYISFVAIVFATAAVCLASVSLYKVDSNKQEKVNTDVNIQLETTTERNHSTNDYFGSKVRRDAHSLMGVVCNVRAGTLHQAARFGKGKAIGPLEGIDATGPICPNPAQATACDPEYAPSDRYGITIRKSGFYYIYGSVEFSPLTEPQQLGWEIIACTHEGLLEPTRSQCDMSSVRNYVGTIRVRTYGVAGSHVVFAGRAIYCPDKTVLSITPLYDDQVITMASQTYLGAILVA